MLPLLLEVETLGVFFLHEANSRVLEIFAFFTERLLPAQIYRKSILKKLLQVNRYTCTFEVAQMGFRSSDLLG